jgi:DNA modification methylase
VGCVCIYDAAAQILIPESSFAPLDAIMTDEIKPLIQNEIIHGDCLAELSKLPAEQFQLIIADPPYFQVLEHAWDNQWESEDDYLAWSMAWISACARVLKPDGLFYIFGQLGKREHAWLHLCSQATKALQFHDLIIWDRAVGYNERGDSFTPCYEMILVLRRKGCDQASFNKDAVRLPYDKKTIQLYLGDKRYQDKQARLSHLEKGKYATNLMRIPSLKGTSKEKAGHPSQKPLKLIENLILSSSRPGDWVLDPFIGSGTTAVVAERRERQWIGIERDLDFCKLARQRIRESQSAMAFFTNE